MNQGELQGLLRSIEVARGTAEGAVAQLRAIESKVQSLLGGGGSYATPEVRGPGEAKPGSGSQDPGTRPEDYDCGILATLPCPRCKAEMVWRWSKANGEWFAGCTEFAGKDGCRGSRSYASVFSGHAKAAPTEPQREPMHTSEGPTWKAEDIERIEKHHGPEAAEDVIPF